MNILSSNDINILDLPDEMLRAIFNKLNMVDMLYSLVDVNQRFDRLALDSLYVYHLDFSIEAFNNYNSSTYTYILDRICSKILPRINQKITELTVDPLSMKRILGAVDYSQLYSLSFVNFEPKILSRHLTGICSLILFHELLIFIFLFKTKLYYIFLLIKLHILLLILTLTKPKYLMKVNQMYLNSYYYIVHV
jgi:hypothetical protein